MLRKKTAVLLKNHPLHERVLVMGWVRSFRSNRFIALYDGSGFETLQIVLPDNLEASVVQQITTGAAIKAVGCLIPSQGKGQKVELLCDSITVLGLCDTGVYPLQPKKHSWEFLRDVAHLRLRTQTFSSVFKVRSLLAFAIHQFFRDRHFTCLHTPIITCSDAEGAGEMFQVTTLDLAQVPKKGTKPDFAQDFFGKAAALTVSGQLEAELGIFGLGEVYTFGPTFRAENSNTARHLAEFWMVEPEMAFYDLADNVQLAEALLKYCINYVLREAPEEMAFLDRRQEEEARQKPQNQRLAWGLIEKLQLCLQAPFQRLTYTEAIAVLEGSEAYKKKKFVYPLAWGLDLQSEHERYLVEKHFKKPIVVTDYPKDIKAFYMRQNEDGRTVAAMDILFPGIGEIVGGSQREERLPHLEARIKALNLPLEEMQWYLDTRRYGSCVHSGFGLGFERLVLFVTGMTNIRDVIPFPRTPGNALF